MQYQYLRRQGGTDTLPTAIGPDIDRRHMPIVCNATETNYLVIGDGEVGIDAKNEIGEIHLARKCTPDLDLFLRVGDWLDPLAPLLPPTQSSG